MAPETGTVAGDAGVNRRIEQQLFALFRRTNSIHVHTSSGDHELERSTYGILCLLDDLGPQRLGAIAAAYHLDPSTVTRQAQAVVRLGLAEKQPDPADGRASLLALTPEGEVAIKGARAHRRQRLDRVMAEWSEPEREEFARSLERFNSALGRLAED
ncbi:MarR family transcriptional regulator [Nocardioides zeae]|uniref:MarR family transcriptional regulator n=1 Tax=Nocardioides imazamoxiresistens TaxID=3231893 RepID=A0ABU3Q161_9ACTN|nr:MarR family transcriptional regulator [Nocardioides zeae]MDT9595239.1 MarR family transcriptional regulator [Nocardioides zeae]